MTLYHFACVHSARFILDGGGRLLPNLHPVLNIPVIWMTSSYRSTAAELGLASTQLVKCNRMAVRFAIDDPVDAVPWSAIRDKLPPRVALQFEGARGTRPALWWISTATQSARVDN
jgi:hypothetical protein